jgi:hypothetical protein
MDISQTRAMSAPRSFARNGYGAWMHRRPVFWRRWAALTVSPRTSYAARGSAYASPMPARPHRSATVVARSARAWAVARPRVALALVAVLATVLAVAVTPAHAAVMPSSGDRRAAFQVAFPAQAVGLDLQLTGPGRCGGLDDLHISIRRAREGRFRFGPQVPGARPRRDGRRLRRWCRGRYRVAVVASGEFEPSPVEVIASGHFTVRSDSTTAGEGRRGAGPAREQEGPEGAVPTRRSWRPGRVRAACRATSNPFTPPARWKIEIADDEVPARPRPNASPG